jgi:Protein of unknown function (DUF4065)
MEDRSRYGGTHVRPASYRARLNRVKFKALVHYICWRCEDPRLLGTVKLNKVLWYAERIWYVRSGQPLAGATYIKQQYGVVAKTLAPLVVELEKEGALSTRERSGGSLMQYFARFEPDLSVFTAPEISVVDSLIETICFRDAPSPVDVSADDQVWKLAQIGETLPYYTVFAARPSEIRKRDMDWAVEQVRRGIGGPELEKLEELVKLNPRIDEAYAALEWHLTRDPSAGLPIPVSNTSFFIYKQSNNRPLTIPGITVIYTIDLDELVICRGRFDLDEEDEEPNNEAQANEGTL